MKIFTSLKTVFSVILQAAGFLFLVIIVASLYLRGRKDPTPYFTGQDLLEAVNEYRTSVGSKELTLDENLCDNLVARWLTINADHENGHKGFEAWAEGEGLIKDGVVVEPYDKGIGLSELFIINAPEVSSAIEAWTVSPGHKIILEDARYNAICTYAVGGTGVMMMARNKDFLD